MPANLTPEYLKAEEAYKQAKTVEEKIAALEHMLAVIPKHKGTDHLQGDLRRRLSKLRRELAKPKAKKGFDPFRIPKQGAGQVILLGPPNSGKSSLLRALTKAEPRVAEFPFTTQAPMPGMAPFEDVQIQLVDLPPITRDYLPPGLLGLVKSTDAALLVCDLASPRGVEELDDVLEVLERGRARLFDPEHPPQEREPLYAYVPALLAANKCDVEGARETFALLEELYAGRFRPLAVSTATGEGLDTLPARLFALLDRIRVYSKEPGKEPDLESPFVLKRGETVLDLARKIHRDFPDHLRQARVWGSARFDGQPVERDFVLADGDIVELHVDL